MRERHKVLRGAAAGFVATVPMTVVMEGLRAALPAERHRRMPPREVVDRSIQKTIETTGEGTQLDRGDRVLLTTIGHFAFGAAAGALYSQAVGSHRASAVTGLAYGLSVWAMAYGVGLPSLGLHPAARDDTRDRNWVLVASHAVWGAALGILSRSTFFGSSVPK